MDNLIFRCHNLASIMGASKGRITDKQVVELKELNAKVKLTKKQQEKRDYLQAKLDNPSIFDLSAGAMSAVRDIVKQSKDVFDYNTQVTNNKLRKGIMCEKASIKLFNEVFFTDFKKNEVRKSNEWISGECDIEAPDTIYDIKTSWSKETFPMLPSEINIGAYEWQLRGYMMLYDKPKAALVYCLVDTPCDLLDFENNMSIHHVEHIPPHLRVTVLYFKRDMAKEEFIKKKVVECRRYAKWYLEQIQAKNN